MTLQISVTFSLLGGKLATGEVVVVLMDLAMNSWLQRTFGFKDPAAARSTF